MFPKAEWRNVIIHQYLHYNNMLPVTKPVVSQPLIHVPIKFIAINADFFPRKTNNKNNFDNKSIVFAKDFDFELTDNKNFKPTQK